jgi:hypothetical protein
MKNMNLRFEDMKTYLLTKGKCLMMLLPILLLASCNGDDPQGLTAQELAFEKLSGTWDISQGGGIVVDGQNVSLNFAGFSLSFTDGGYNTNNAGDLFMAVGSWTWADSEARQLSLDDGKQVTIVTLTEQQFVFRFSFTGTGGEANHGEGISGSYTITVNKP